MRHLFIERSHPFEWLDDATAFVDQQMEQDGGHDWGHLSRVLRHAYDISDGRTDVDLEVLTAAVLFHDVVNLPKDHPERSTGSARSADVARGYFDFDDKRSAVLQDAIECHSFSAGKTPETREGAILRDSDRLESLGALGIARVFYVSGLMNGHLFHAEDPFATDRTLDDVSYALDHFYKKVLKLEATMLTDAGKKRARDYTQFVEVFLERLSSEISQ